MSVNREVEQRLATLASRWRAIYGVEFVPEGYYHDMVHVLAKTSTKEKDEHRTDVFGAALQGRKLNLKYFPDDMEEDLTAYYYKGLALAEQYPSIKAVFRQPGVML